MSLQPHMSVPGALTVHDLWVRYPSGPWVLEEVSFNLEPGQCLLVTGPSGSGKSTLALALAGLMPGVIPAAVKGQVSVGGLDLLQAAPEERLAAAGIVFQGADHQVVMDQVEAECAFTLENLCWPRQDISQRVQEVLVEFQLEQLGQRPVQQLSGGQLQRLLLAGQAGPRPRLLVLDEPSAHLDPEGLQAVRELVQRRRGSQTLVVIEHQADYLADLVDQLLVLEAGQVRASGSARRLWSVRGPALHAMGAAVPGNKPRDRKLPGVDATSEPVLSCCNLSYAFRSSSWGYSPGAEPVFRNVNLAIRPSEVLSLEGVNGSGKTTLARVLSGIYAPLSGTVKRRGRVGYVFQEPERQFTASTAAAEIARHLDGGSPQEVDDLLARVGLAELHDRHPYRLSQGQQRRLAIASQLALEPAALILDEPAVGLDDQQVEQLEQLLVGYLQAGGAILLISHDERLQPLVQRRLRLQPPASAEGSPQGSGNIPRSTTGTGGWLAAVHPAAKLAAIMVLALVPLLASSPWPPVASIVLTVLALLSSGQPPRRWLRFVLPATGFALALGFTTSVFYKPSLVQGPIWFQLGPLLLAPDSLWSGLVAALRVVAVAGTSALVTLTTAPSTLALGLAQLSWFPYRFAFGFLVGYRFLPELAQDYETIRAASRLRRHSGESWPRTWSSLLQRFAQETFAALAASIRRATLVADAMDARGFGLYPQRTYLRQVPFLALDWWFMLAAMVVTIFMILGFHQLDMVGLHTQY